MPSKGGKIWFKCFPLMPVFSICFPLLPPFCFKMFGRRTFGVALTPNTTKKSSCSSHPFQPSNTLICVHLLHPRTHSPFGRRKDRWPHPERPTTHRPLLWVSYSLLPLVAGQRRVGCSSSIVNCFQKGRRNGERCCGVQNSPPLGRLAASWTQRISSEK